MIINSLIRMEFIRVAEVFIIQEKMAIIMILFILLQESHVLSH